MVWFLFAVGGLWLLGRLMNAPIPARWLMIGLLYVLVLCVLVIVPVGHPVQRALGGSLGEWLVLGVLAAIVFGYTQILRQARVRAKPPEPAAKQGAFNAGEIDRYARHIMLREIGGPGQKALKEARVLVIGAGGLGAPALMYLAAAGVGRIGVVDEDVVEATNLQRQIIHSDARIGMPKVFSAEIAMRALNPYADIRPYNRRLTPEIAKDLVGDYDLILDGTDNFDTRYLVNLACVDRQKPLISGALTQWEGQISVFDTTQNSPCYKCIFPDPPAAELVPTCAEAGVLGPLPGVVGAMMASEAIKVLTGAGETLTGRMMIYDALYGETRTIGLKRREDCPVCGSVNRGAA